MDIAIPILNLKEQRKCKHKILYIPRKLEKIDCSESPVYNCSANGNENPKFPLVLSMQNGHKPSWSSIPFFSNAQ